LYAKNYLHGDHSVFVLLLTVFSLDVGAGSLLCERLSGHKVEIGLVLFAVIQTRCDPRHLSRTIAGMNIMNALFMLTAVLLTLVLLQSGFTIPQIFLVTAILNVLVALYIFTVAPEYLVRFMAWILIYAIHRLKTISRDLIPAESAAVLVCNQVSYVYAIFIMAAGPRPIRLVMDHRIFKIPVLSGAIGIAKAIPIAPDNENLELMKFAFA
jgi:hypothetical protein